MNFKFDLKEFTLSVGRIVLTASVSGYVLFSLFLYVEQDSLIFYPQPISKAEANSITEFYKSSTEEINVSTPDGAVLHGWLNKEITADGKPAPLIIYFGGNGEEISHAINDKKLYFGYSLALVNYRGYGLSTGEPSETNLFKDALLIYDTLSKRQDIDGSRIVLMGVSIGSGVATYLASKRKTTGAIFITPFESLLSVAKDHYPLLPIENILKHKFESNLLAPKIDTPLLVIAGDKDKLIPIKHSKALFESWGKNTNLNKKEFITIKGAQHNNIFLSRQYWIEIDNFLKSLK